MRAIVSALFMVVLFEAGAQAQPGQTPPSPAPDPAAQPAPADPYPAQPPPGQPYPGQAPAGQPYPAQPYPGQPPAGQPYPGQPYSGQPYPGQPYPGQPSPGQPYPGQAYPGQPYPSPYPYPGPAVQLTEDEQELLAQGEISDGRYLGGAMASVFFGLGIGQAIQGRYGDTGKIFTIGEVGTTVVVLVGAIGTINSEGSNNSAGTFLVGGLVGLVAFRVWEDVGAFAGPPSHNAKLRQLRMRLGLPPVYARVVPYVAPSMSRTGPGTAGLTFRF